MSHINRARLHITLSGPWRIYQNAPLPGWQMLGTVQRGMSIGALGLSPAGLYAQINSGAVRPLNQRKVSAALTTEQTPC